ncbi:serine/threonine protein kinase [Streptomyces sp. NBC_00485]|uniref:WD40 repeat domain-containing serine/threonine protein kinase n=1 Tax=unclassified Streptomyces TaxID=2593676 RepID=UPI002E19BAB0|nr:MULTISPECIES: serine/threonine-protein kinase [unclassified Streptomyces]
MDGTILVDRYRLVRPLGEGGMGQVWEAHDQRLGRSVAVKLISALAGEGSRSDEARARFLQEAQFTAALQHDNIVTVHDLGEATTANGTTPFLVMELLRGRGLDVILGGGPVNLADAARWGLQMCFALGEAHASGILHRDIKPANIIVTATGAVKVVDFGIAKAADPAMTSGLTQTGFIVGTPQYMSPEQAQDGPEKRSDLYALGCVLFEMITGNLPFKASSPAGYLAAHLRDTPLAPSSVAADIPAAWDKVVLTLLQKDPGDRYASAADLAERLRELAADPGAGENGPPRTQGRFSPKYLRTIATLKPVRDLSFSPDGRRLAFVQDNGPALVTDLSGQRLFQLDHGDNKPVSCVAFSPDGRRLATGAKDKTLRFWDASTGQETGRITSTMPVGELVFSPDGTRVAAWPGLRLWDVGTGEVLLERPKGMPGIAFSPDGTRLAARSVTFWGGHQGSVLHVTDGNELLKFKSKDVEGLVGWCLAFSPDGDRLAAACGGAYLVIHDANTGGELLRLDHRIRGVNAVAYSPHGDWLATGSRDKTARLWHSRTGDELLKITHAKQVNSVAFSPDGSLLATAGGDAAVQLWALTD